MRRSQPITLAGLVATVLLAAACATAPAPEPIASLPRFSLIDEHGRTLDNDTLAGQTWIANAFFTRCTTVCPRLSSAVRSLQERYVAEGVDGVRLVSISVDPGHDTPERLTAYGRALGADDRRWTLATGSEDQIRSLLTGGFMTHVGERSGPGDGLFDIAHSARLFLVDGRGRLRGFYDADAAGLDAAYDDSIAVLRESE